jgi:hypothetical protein
MQKKQDLHSISTDAGIMNFFVNSFSENVSSLSRYNRDINSNKTISSDLQNEK